ncbi:MAG: hypothetical protein EBY39_03105 [Flavobacteriia bacterium]|nr:hypothetical protein [Flavobacteriia bacterium]
MAVNNNNKVKAILSQIQKARPSKEELEKKEVALSLVNDIESDLDFFENAFNEAVYLIDSGDEWLDRIADFRSEVQMFWDNAVVNGSAKMLDEVGSSMGQKIDELEQKAEDLGVDPASLVSNYADIKGMLSGYEITYDMAQKAYYDVQEAMNNQGIANFW